MNTLISFEFHTHLHMPLLGNSKRQICQCVNLTFTMNYNTNNNTKKENKNNNKCVKHFNTIWCISHTQHMCCSALHQYCIVFVFISGTLCNLYTERVRGEMCYCVSILFIECKRISGLFSSLQYDLNVFAFRVIFNTRRRQVIYFYKLI